ncbi:hypothetical protein [Photobacterium leiognathi]|uniref:hypothetical protein n=1 Tax=Photobacterium leiognathi TaxID=553611 RepID=UPI002982AA1E|nr:hypothetical protein [Photobacterium leiognathi]
MKKSAISIFAFILSTQSFASTFNYEYHELVSNNSNAKIDKLYKQYNNAIDINLHEQKIEDLRHELLELRHRGVTLSYKKPIKCNNTFLNLNKYEMNRLESNDVELISEIVSCYTRLSKNNNINLGLINYLPRITDVARQIESDKLEKAVHHLVYNDVTGNLSMTGEDYTNKIVNPEGFESNLEIIKPFTLSKPDSRLDLSTLHEIYLLSILSFHNNNRNQSIKFLNKAISDGEKISKYHKDFNSAQEFINYLKNVKTAIELNFI